tara:strand:- start:3071 stop:5242 length:2172 start_codon:yes stop_codon:yes gene_type:complete
MKKIVINLFFIIIILTTIAIVILSTVGIETNKFNKLIIDKASQTKNIKLKLETIKFKINPKEFSLFIETKKPKVIYREILIPIQNIKIYIDFLTLLKSEPIIKKTTLILEEIDLSKINEISAMIKPSNFKSLLKNKIKEGVVIAEIEFYFNKNGELKNFITKGKVQDLKIELLDELNFSNSNLEFFADKNDILIKNIFGNLEKIKILDGDVKLNLENGMKLNSNFNSELNLDEKFFEKYNFISDKYKFSKNIKNLEANFNNNLYINFDKTYKIKDYNYKVTGKLDKSKLQLVDIPKNNYIVDKIEFLNLSNVQISTLFKPSLINFKGKGKYSLNEIDFLNMDLENVFSNNKINFKLDFDYQNSFDLPFINYKKSKNSLANIKLDLEKTKDKLKINNLVFKEKENLISINSLLIEEYNLSSFKNIKVKTLNNDFLIQNFNEISIKGNQFDASNLAKFLSNNEGKNFLKNINNKIEISFKKIKVPMSEELQDFRLIGELEKGQFVKISSKGDYGDNNFLDISMKKDKNSNKKYLEIYSDLAQPLLTEYNFFNGLSGGKLFFTSEIGELNSKSNLKIENFKVINAPGVVKLLSLADLGGLADLAEGEGLSFDILEIDMEKNKSLLKINEILALGSSISVLMEGYQDVNGITSLRGTLVPAKTLNKMISKIPVIGTIVIPKEAGEGLFGISFKMKGPKGKIKTTINPIRTLTPRFIQKIIDRNKETK